MTREENYQVNLWNKISMFMMHPKLLLAVVIFSSYSLNLVHRKKKEKNSFKNYYQGRLTRMCALYIVTNHVKLFIL